MSQTRMFVADGKRVRTWNPVVGCNYLCSYCWARDLAEGRLRHLPRYRGGFKPQLIESELRRRFHQGMVFVSSMGELWGPWVKVEWIRAVFEVVRASPGATFLMLTKNPERYLKFRDEMPPNVVLGATIETNRRLGLLSKAPSVFLRAGWMAHNLGRPKMVSIEPIMDFDLEPFVKKIRDVGPACVYVGYDNHWKHLPEPPLAKTRELIAALGEFTEVRAKTIRKAWWE